MLPFFRYCGLVGKVFERVAGIGRRIGGGGKLGIG
jgi:hypothetical protein